MKMSQMFKTTLAAAMIMALAVTAGCGGGGDKKSAGSEKVTLKLAHNLPTAHPLAQGMEAFNKKLTEKSNGTITLNIYPSGQLFNDKSMNDAIMSGGIDMGLNSTAMWSTVIPAMEVFDVPFLFPSYEKVDHAIDGGLGDKLAGELKKKGVRPVIWADYGFVQFANSKKEITKPEDFAGLKAVGESVAKPWEYYENNIAGTLTLVDVMRKHNVKNIIFSSSATVYGDPAIIPITEECPKGQCTNPYGWTKSMLEQILTDLHKADPEWNVVLLRYFNPIGAHESGLMGEDPKGIPNNLLPYIAQVAIGKLECLGVFGDDYDTPDGTGVRDYIHVVDLAIGHVKALKKIQEKSGVSIYNLGTGVGYSVLDVLHAFEKACGKEIPYQIKPRRAGDIAMCYADPAKAAKVLGWKAEKGLDEMCADTWRWQSQNPNGYEA